MCLLFPDCNADVHVDDRNFSSCSDYMSCNHKAMGGYAGIATAMVMATEFQGDGTPHGHGFIPLANVYQHATLKEIAKHTEANGKTVVLQELTQQRSNKTNLMKNEFFGNVIHLISVFDHSLN